MDELLSFDEITFLVKAKFNKHLNFLNEIRKVKIKDLISKEFLEKINSCPEGDILSIIIHKIIYHCECLKLSREKISTIIAIFTVTHIYYLMKSWNSTENVYARFEKLILKQCLMGELKSSESWDPMDCYKISIFFRKLYFHNLPLIDMFVNTTYQVNIRLNQLKVEK